MSEDKVNSLQGACGECEKLEELLKSEMDFDALIDYMEEHFCNQCDKQPF